MNALLAWRPWAVAAVAAVMFLSNLGAAHLWDDDEPKNARCGAEMYEAGEWVVPSFNGELRDHKPVLLYWAMIASYAVFGVNEFAAQLPSALSGIAVVVMGYHLGRLLFDQTVGLFAGLLLASGLMFAVLSRAATPDGVLMLGTTTALLCFVAGVAARRGGGFSGSGEPPPLASFRLPLGWAIGMYAALGVAVLAKGPIGVLLPLWAICLYGLFGERLDDRAAARLVGLTGWRRLAAWAAFAAAPMRWVRGAWSIRMPMGLLIVAAVAAPWYVAVSQQTEGAWLSGFFGTHNFGRFTSAMEGHDGPIFYYVVAILAGFFPASCFLPVAVVGSTRERHAWSRLAPSHAFVLAYVAAWVSFFSLAATKLPNYVIPCYVGLALATAAWLVSAMRWTQSARSWLGAGLASSCVAGLAIAVALGVVGGVLMGGTPLIALAGVLPIVGGAVGLWLLHARRPAAAAGAFVVGSLAFTHVGTAIVAPVASPYADGPRIAAMVERLEAAGRPITFATHRYTVPSLVWTLQRPVPGLDAEETVDRLADPDTVVVMPLDAYETMKADLPAGVVKLADEGRFLRTEKRVVLVGRLKLVARLQDKSTFR